MKRLLLTLLASGTLLLPVGAQDYTQPRVDGRDLLAPGDAPATELERPGDFDTFPDDGGSRFEGRDLPERSDLPDGEIEPLDGTGRAPGIGVPAEEPDKPKRVANAVAVFSGLDKITGRITEFDVYVDETVQFGVLQVTPRVCFSRPKTEEPKTTTFIEVDEITLDRKMKRIFSGWMFAESPGLNAVEHPVNDVWLKGCKQTSKVAPPPGRDGG